MNLTRAKRLSLAKLLFKVGGVIMTIQLLLSSSQFSALDNNTMAIIMGFVSIIGGLNTALYQYLHDNIPSRIAISGLLMAFISTCGGINELVKILPINGQLGVNITFVISIIAFVLQLVSKTYYVPNK
jgi:hypothetical protein